jgi:cell division septation protein DedD
MEQQKVFIIIISVAIFIAAVLAIGLWWFYPRNGSESVANAGSAGTAPGTEDNSFDPIEWVRNSEEFPEFVEKEESEVKDVVIVYGEAEDDSAASSGDSIDRSGTVEIVQKKPAMLKKEPVTVAVAEKPVPRTEKAPEIREKAAPKPETIQVIQYWIQTGSFTSKGRAESEKERLNEKGITGVIFTRDVGDRSVYRLRVGPWESKPEAEKFLGWMKALEGLDQSKIWETYISREI